jgi:hypothetical protein
VVFPKNSMSVNQSWLDELGNLIHDSYIPVHDRICYWNEMGTKNNGFSGDGQIYIDCQPTGEEGEIIYKEQLSSSKPMSMEWIYAFLAVIIGCIIMYVAKKLFYFCIQLMDKVDLSKDN